MYMTKKNTLNVITSNELEDTIETIQNETHREKKSWGERKSTPHQRRYPDGKKT